MSAVALDLIPDAGFAASGVGPAIFVGRNRTIDLSLSLADIATAGTLDVSVETAASAQAPTWRKLGAFAQATAAGAYAFSPSGADSFIRARYALSTGAELGFSVTGSASLSLLASSTIAASGVSAAVDVGQFRGARLTLDVSALTGAAPVLDVTVETAATATGATWRTVATFDTVTAASTVDLTCADFDRSIRIRSTLSSGATATLSVVGESVFVFAGPAERARLGIRGGAIPDVQPSDAAEAMIAASAIVLGYLGRFELPLRAWGDDLRRACIIVADWILLSNRGADPSKAPGAELYRIAYEDMTGRPGQRGWLDKVAARDGVVPAGIVDSTNPGAGGELRRLAVSSEPLRGWGSSLPKVYP